MIVNAHRGKLINASLSFSKNTLHCSKAKLFALLFVFDFEHCKATGRSSTGSDYFALPNGAAPLAHLHEFDMDDASDDFRDAFDLSSHCHSERRILLVQPRRAFDPLSFTKREIALLTQIASDWQTYSSAEMSQAPTASRAAWEKIWQEGQGLAHKIPCSLPPDMEAARQDSLEFISHFCDPL